MPRSAALGSRGRDAAVSQGKASTAARPQKLLLTVADAAEALSVSEKYIRRLTLRDALQQRLISYAAEVRSGHHQAAPSPTAAPPQTAPTAPDQLRG